jgi:hypothetical protein
MQIKDTFTESRVQEKITSMRPFLLEDALDPDKRKRRKESRKSGQRAQWERGGLWKQGPPQSVWYNRGFGQRMYHTKNIVQRKQQRSP